MSGTIAIFASVAETVSPDDILAALASLGVEATFQSRLGSTDADDWELAVITSSDGEAVDVSTRPVPPSELDEIARAYNDVLSDRLRRTLVTATREYRITPTDSEAASRFPSQLAHAFASHSGGLIQDIDGERFYLSAPADRGGVQP